MADLKNKLPAKSFEILERAGIATPKEIIILSMWDIKKLTNLPTDDIIFIKNAVSDYLCPERVTCDKLLLKDKNNARVTTGCDAIDRLLGGGLRRGTLSEIYGESGSGKTQVALQAAAYNWITGCVYICTEDVFPIKRFEQLKQSISDFNSDTDYGKNIFVEHVTEASDLLSCLRVRLPKLLEKNKLSLIIIDSVAAPFRTDYVNYVQRAEDLREMAVSLIRAAQKHNLAVLCINQVTANFTAENVLPSLGLAWSNMVGTRIWLKKTSKSVDLRSIATGSHEDFLDQHVFVREMSIIFAPDLPKSKTELIITPTGVQSF